MSGRESEGPVTVSMGTPRLVAASLLLALVALAACSPGATRAGISAGAASDSAELAGIARLHAADQRAVLARDTAALLNLWSEEPVALPPDGPNLIGRAAIAAMLAPMARTPDSTRAWQTVGYTQQFSEVHVIGDETWAWDMGVANTVLENRKTGRRVTVSAKLLRILKKAPSGEWKVHRSMWTRAEPQEAGG